MMGFLGGTDSGVSITYAPCIDYIKGGKLKERVRQLT